MAFSPISPFFFVFDKQEDQWRVATSDAMTTQQSLTNFGFKFGKSGAHDSRTMMLPELRALFLVPISIQVDSSIASISLILTAWTSPPAAPENSPPVT